MRVAIVAAVCAAGLISCAKTDLPTTGAPEVVRPVQTDMTTPDKALKSFWAVRDAVRKTQADLFAKHLEEYRASQGQINAVAAGALAKTFAAEVDVPETFSRDIVDVKVESESRAVIVASIKNTSAIAAGAEPSKYEEERRRDGDRYKYVLERDQTGWRVAEIWEWRAYPSPDWKKSRPDDGKPRVPSLTYYGV